LFKYKPGTWEKCKNELLTYYQSESLQDSSLTLSSEEDTYNIYLHSETLLTRLLSFASIICVLTAIFGIYSLVTLTCEQRRKEIAIRKVNGAGMKDLYKLLFRKYVTVLVIAFVIAIPLAYYAVHTYTADFVVKASLGIDVFVIALLIVALISLGTLFWQVRKAASINPSEVMKSE
jgi:ABC-type antimicrobial peptide transport system permease subunit